MAMAIVLCGGLCCGARCCTGKTLRVCIAAPAPRQPQSQCKSLKDPKILGSASFDRGFPWPVSCMKFGGTSVADVDRIKQRRPQASRPRSTPATRWRLWSRPWPARPTSWWTWTKSDMAAHRWTRREYDTVVVSLGRTGDLRPAGPGVLQDMGVAGALVAGLADARSAPTSVHGSRPGSRTSKRRNP